MPIEWDGRQALLGFARDVTSRKEMEARLGQSERLAALGHAARRHRARDEQPAVVHVARHRAGDGAARAPRRRPPRTSPSCATRSASALHGATRVAAVVGQIRASSRPDVDERGPVDLRAVIEAALRVTHNEIHHRARLVTDLAEVPPVVGSAQRLEQVFLNLLVNAVQALPDGRAENEIRVVLRLTPRARSSSRSATTAPASPTTSARASSIPSSRPSPSASGSGSASRSATASSRTTAARSPSRARPGAARRSGSCCRRGPP